MASKKKTEKKPETENKALMTGAFALSSTVPDGADFVVQTISKGSQVCANFDKWLKAATAKNVKIALVHEVFAESVEAAEAEAEQLIKDLSKRHIPKSTPILIKYETKAAHLQRQQHTAIIERFYKELSISGFIPYLFMSRALIVKRLLIGSLCRYRYILSFSRVHPALLGKSVKDCDDRLTVLGDHIYGEEVWKGDEHHGTNLGRDIMLRRDIFASAQINVPIGTALIKAYIPGEGITSPTIKDVIKFLESHGFEVSIGPAEYNN